MKSTVNVLRVMSGTFLIAGTMIGAGMLGIPLVTGEAGFIPGMVITLAVWFFMYCTGLLFLEVTLWMPDGSNVLSISGKFFGKGKLPNHAFSNRWSLHICAHLQLLYKPRM